MKHTINISFGYLSTLKVLFLAKLILSVIGIKFIIAGNLLMAYDLTWNIKSIPVLIGNHTQSQHGKSQVSSIEIGKRTKLVR